MRRSSCSCCHGRQPPSSAVLSLVLLALCLRQGAGKVQTLKVKLGAGFRQKVEWVYVGKFGYGVGTNTFSARVKEVFPMTLPPNTKLDFESYLDEEWPLAEATTDLCSRKGHARRLRILQTGPKGKFGPWINGTVRQSIRPHVWYYAISDCNHTLKNTTYTLQLEFITLQEGGSHFSIELQWAPLANLVNLLGCSLFLWSFWRRSCAFYRSAESLHPVIWTLGAVVLIQYVAQCLHTGHLAIYRSDGMGSRVMEVLSEIFFHAAQVVQTTLLITIGSGYTLVQSKLGDLDVVVPVCFLVLIMHVILVMLDTLQSEASHRFTEHDGAKGWTFFSLRLALFGWFCWAVRGTSQGAGLRLQTFLARFRLAASLYFLAYPATFLIVQLCAPYIRKPVMEFGIMSAQVGSNIWLASLFLDRGAYFEASSLGASPLPGGGSPVRFFKKE